MSKNIYLLNGISSSFFNKKIYFKDKKKLNEIINNIFNSLDIKKNIFHSLSKKFDFNFKNSQLVKFNKYKSVIIIGMGGSALGAEALYSFFKDKIQKNFIFFNNLDQLKIENIKKKKKFKK